jgi:ribose 5-phosphate isomerase B
MMKWIIASDHAGFELKEFIKKHFPQLELEDLGPFSSESVNYTDFAHHLASSIENGTADRGILICGSGVGVSITANRHPGVRAALAWQPEIAKLCRQHNNANVLCLPARFISSELAVEMIQIFIDEPFEGGRHQTRVQSIELK